MPIESCTEAKYDSLTELPTDLHILLQRIDLTIKAVVSSDGTYMMDASAFARSQSELRASQGRSMLQSAWGHVVMMMPVSPDESCRKDVVWGKQGRRIVRSVQQLNRAKQT